ncbi:unnamed protein product, partial [Urochloa humidicola]
IRFPRSSSFQRSHLDPPCLTPQTRSVRATAVDDRVASESTLKASCMCWTPRMKSSDMEVDADGVEVATEGVVTVNGLDLSVEGPPLAGD